MKIKTLQVTIRLAKGPKGFEEQPRGSFYLVLHLRAHLYRSSAHFKIEGPKSFNKAVDRKFLWDEVFMFYYKKFDFTILKLVMGWNMLTACDEVQTEGIPRLPGGATMRCHFWKSVVFRQSLGDNAYALCLDISSCIGSNITHSCKTRKITILTMQRTAELCGLLNGAENCLLINCLQAAKLNEKLSWLFPKRQRLCEKDLKGFLFLVLDNP